MEEKDSTESGSMGINSETESPPLSVGGLAPPAQPQPQQQPFPQPQPLPPPQPQLMSMAVTNSGGVINGGSGESMLKKRRGRPRKYDSDGNLRVPYNTIALTPPPGFSLSHSSDYSSKRGRGRPPGSGNWQLLASLGELFVDTAGGDFTPHVINVYTGEDVALKILSLSHKGPRGICVLSANGAVSNVTIRQPCSSGGILTYEGRFEILSLNGSFTISETGSIKSRTGGLSVSLAGADGRVIGGCIAGTLIAASPIQTVVGSFLPNAYKTHKKKRHYEQRMAPGIQNTLDVVTAARPFSEAAPSIISPSQVPMSHLLPVENHVQTDEGVNEVNPNSSSTDAANWIGTVPESDQRPSPDINVSAPDE